MPCLGDKPFSREESRQQIILCHARPTWRLVSGTTSICPSPARRVGKDAFGQYELIFMLKSAGQHRAGHAASICRRLALRHGLIRELLIVVIPPSLLRANAESDPRARSAQNSRIQEIISWVLLGEIWAAFKRILNTLTEPYRMSSRYMPCREGSTSRSRIYPTLDMSKNPYG